MYLKGVFLEKNLIDTKKKSITTLADTNKMGFSNISKPFSSEILLFRRIRVAGTKNIFNIEEIINDLKVNQKMVLLRDPKHLSDRWAVRVIDSKGRSVGFLSSDCSEVVSRLMDAGKKMFAKIENIEKRPHWNLIELEVYLDD